MNIVEIAGHLGADPETRFTNSLKVTTLRIATNSRRAGKEETTWWRATLWGDRFDKLMPYLKKGSAVIIIGEMKKPEIYTGKDGQPQVSLEITAEIIRFSPFGRTNREGGQQQGGQQGGFGEQTFGGGDDNSGSSYGSGQDTADEEETVPF